MNEIILKHLNELGSKLEGSYGGKLIVLEEKDFKPFTDELVNKLSINDASKCNSVKDPNIIKTYALITNKEGLIDVWSEGECLGKGLDEEGINALNLI